MPGRFGCVATEAVHVVVPVTSICWPCRMNLHECLRTMLTEDVDGWLERRVHAGVSGLPRGADSP